MFTWRLSLFSVMAFSYEDMSNNRTSELFTYIGAFERKSPMKGFLNDSSAPA